MIASVGQMRRKALNRLLRWADRLWAPTLPISGEEAHRIRDRFRAISSEYASIYQSLTQSEDAFGDNSAMAEGSYPWDCWQEELAGAFLHGVPEPFLEHPTVKATMVFHGRSCHAARMRLVRTAFGRDTADRLVVEDPVGAPHLCGRDPVTSPNRLHHATHLAQYLVTMGKGFSSQGLIVEWGGGYGDAARLVRRLAPAVTYVIIDLAADGALQYVYLATLLGDQEVTVVASPSTPLQCGGVNLMTSSVAFAHPALAADAFISTWALTESPRALQERVVDRRFFRARNLLLAFSMDQDNHTAAAVSELGGKLFPVPNMTAEGYSPSFYGFL